jgi:hypothetical protein
LCNTPPDSIRNVPELPTSTPPDATPTSVLTTAMPTLLITARSLKKSAVGNSPLLQFAVFAQLSTPNVVQLMSTASARLPAASPQAASSARTQRLKFMVDYLEELN